MNWVLFGVFFYIIAQLVVGLVVSRGIRSESDYLVAGRSLGLGLATFSIFATWFGAETCIGAAGKFYSEGLAGGTTDPFGYTAALVISGIVFAVPLWRRGLTTLADLFRNRYSPGVERFAALMMAPTSVFWAAAQIRAFGGVLHSLSSWGISASIAVSTAVVILYTCTGGLLADVMTDFVQGIAIIVGLFVLVGVLICSPSVHLAAAWKSLDPERLQLFGPGKVSGWAALEMWSVTILGSVVAQEVVSRILATKSPAVARRSTLLGGAMYLSIGLIPAGLGLIGPGLMPGLQDGEHFLPQLAQQHLSTFLYVLFVGALISAILSTVDSTLLAASSLVSHNFIVSLRPEMTDRRRLILARSGVVVFGLLAYFLARGAESVFDLVQQANGIGSAGIFVLMVFGLFFKFGGKRAGMATLLAGFGFWIYGTYVGHWTCTYLTSLAAAFSAYVLAGLTEGSSATLREEDPQSPTQVKAIR